MDCMQNESYYLCLDGKLQELMKTLSMDIALGVAIALLPIVVLIYVIWQLTSTISRWMSANKIYKSNAVSLQSGGGSYALLDASNDNNDVTVDPKDLAPTDDYDTITKTIKNMFANYETYNSALTSYYSNVRQENAPDVIDQTSLLPENDNW